METRPWVVVQMQTDSLGSGLHSSVPDSIFLSMHMTVSPFPLVHSPPTSPPASSEWQKCILPLHLYMSGLFECMVVTQVKNYLLGEKFAGLRFKLLVVDFYLFFLLLFISL